MEELLGSPIGGAAFSRLLVEKRIQKVAAALEVLPTLEDSHVEFCLLRSCLSLPKIAFSLRTCSPGVLAPCLASFDGHVRDCLGSILGSALDDRTWRQASLPVSQGGLGLRRAALHSAGSYAVSLAHSSALVTSMLGPRLFRPPALGSALTLLNSHSDGKFTFDELKSTTQKTVSHSVDVRCLRLLCESATDR